MARRDSSKPFQVPVENRLSNPAAPPGGVEKGKGVVRVLSVFLLLPPDAGIPDGFSVDLDKQQVFVGIAIVKMFVSGRDRRDAVGALYAVSQFGRADDPRHMRIVALAPEQAKAEASDARCPGNGDGWGWHDPKLPTRSPTDSRINRAATS